ncbi:hypothetical protein [Paracidovorax cattleyae]|uniref:hypothetical protein n=1 Tax=Paracidovorax cattleyae TaxID=80868 RepID=UPI00115FD76A|nr:hypothetical protein [Paracidovorax cattleyae]
MTFSLESTTGDSLCSLDGTIDGGQGVARLDGGRSSCMVCFGRSAQGIDVKAATRAEWRDFCGCNGSFAGRYMRVKEGCGRNEVDRTRAAFQRLYDRRNSKAALAALSSVLEKFSVTLDWEDEGGHSQRPCHHAVPQRATCPMPGDARQIRRGCRKG